MKKWKDCRKKCTDGKIRDIVVYYGCINDESDDVYRKVFSSIAMANKFIDSLDTSEHKLICTTKE